LRAKERDKHHPGAAGEDEANPVLPRMRRVKEKNRPIPMPDPASVLG